MLCREIIGVCSEVCTEPINAFCGQDAEFQCLPFREMYLSLGFKVANETPEFGFLNCAWRYGDES
jgi:hypothetical protein